jgi:hypothetical protein
LNVTVLSKTTLPKRVFKGILASFGYRRPLQKRLSMVSTYSDIPG